MNRTLRTVGVFFCLLALASCTKSGPHSSSDPEEIVLGFNPAENVDVVQTNAAALAKIVQDKTGLKLKTYVATDFGSLVEAMRSGQVNLAFLPGFSFIQAEKNAGGKVLLKAVRAGRPHYYSAIITSKPEFKSVQDLKGKTIAWTDPSSASGHIMPKSALMDMNIDPDTFFARQVFAGGHDALVLSVLNGTVDAGATLVNDPEGKEGIWLQYLKDPEKLKRVRVLYVAPKPVPGDTFSTTDKYYATHKAAIDKLVAIMVDLKATPEGKKVLKDLYHIDEMVPATAEEYEPLRVAAKRLNITK